MMRSIFSAVSGLVSHQTKMDVVGNNIANVNTAGYKSSAVNFKEMFAQTLSSATAPQEDRGGVNPSQVGLGTMLSNIKVNHTQGQMETTGNPTDMAIDGEGFFIVRDGERVFYSRSGDFSLDRGGNLVSGEGLRVGGWMAQNGEINTNRPIENISIPVGQVLSPASSTQVLYDSNLDARAEVGQSVTRAINIYDSQGNPHRVDMQFAKTGENEWAWEASSPTAASLSNEAGVIQFTTDGRILEGSLPTTPMQLDYDGVESVLIDLDFSSITQYADDMSVRADNQNGYPLGTLRSFSVEDTGVITGYFSNGLTESIGRIGLAVFNNVQGLVRTWGSLFEESVNSGTAQYDVPGAGRRGLINPEQLEMSNVELPREFTQMITTQRGFQANSRVISVSDQMLEELVNLKR